MKTTSDQNKNKTPDLIFQKYVLLFEGSLVLYRIIGFLIYCVDLAPVFIKIYSTN